MTEIINEPKIQNPLIVKFRELLNHHAFWLYLLTDEAEKEDLTPPGGACQPLQSAVYHRETAW